MPNGFQAAGRWKGLPAKVLGTAVVGLFLCLTGAGVDARAAEWPLVFPKVHAADIPGDQGMAFFIGTWEQTSSWAAGGDLTITDKALAFRQSDDPRPIPYKVLYTASNYVLLAVKRTFPDDFQWTSFKVLTVRNPERSNGFRNLIENTCTEISMERPEPFDWPVDKLLEAFKSSRCLDEVNKDQPDQGLGGFWAKFNYQWAGRHE